MVSIPVVILTGFLGAGKTSLLNRLLLQQRQLKIAVIENEFGEVAIDNELLASNALNVADQVIVLENGCMCCTVRGDILGAFASIEKQVLDGYTLDMVLIETTGMANPLPIVRTITQTPKIAKHFYMKGVLTLVDACNITKLLNTQNQEAISQISLADLIILSKVDLVDPTSIHSTTQVIKHINPHAPIVPCIRGDMDFSSMMSSLTSFDLQKVGDTIDMQIDSHEHLHGNGCSSTCGEDHDNTHHHHSHDHEDGDCSECSSASNHTATKSFSIIENEKYVDPFLFAHWMRRLVMPTKDSNAVLYRSKAILSVYGSYKHIVFHAVGDIVEREWLYVPNIEGCKIVFIGQNLDEKNIRESFNAILYSPPSQNISVVNDATSLDILSRLPPVLLHRTMRYLYTGDVVGVVRTCRGLHTKLIHASEQLDTLGKDILKHDRHGVYLHSAIPVATMPSFMKAWNEAKVEIGSLFGLTYLSTEHVEAAAVAWIELARLAESSCKSFALDFKWRPETLATFFSTPTAQTSSTLLKVEYDYEDEYESITDVLRFRVFLIPVFEGESDEAQESKVLLGHKLQFQLTGGRTSSQIYQVSFHSVHPHFQVHVAVPDHRVPRVDSKEVFYPLHPLLNALQTEHHLRFVVRVKPDGSGPLGDMCSCC